MGHSLNTAAQRKRTSRIPGKPTNKWPTGTTPLQAMLAIAIIITTIMEHIQVYIKEIPVVTRKTMQALKSMTAKISCSKLMQNIRESYRTAMLAITIVTRTANHTSRINQQQQKKIVGINKTPQAHENLVTNMMECDSYKVIVTTIKAKCKPVSDVLRKD